MNKKNISKSKKEIIKVTKNEVENALAKLLFNLTAAIYYNSLSKYKKYFQEILDKTTKWIKYYAEDGNLLRMSEEEAKGAIKSFNKIPFEAYNEDFFEEVDTWLTVVIYYGSCPIDQEFEKNQIKRKDGK